MRYLTYLKPIEKLANIIISRELEKKAEKLDIIIGNSLYLHGYYDWVICFTAKDIKQAMKFNELIKKMYIDYIKETKLHENIFAVKRDGILNPDLKELKNLF